MKRSVFKSRHIVTVGDAARLMQVSLPCEPWEKPDDPYKPEAGPTTEPKEKVAGTDKDKRRGLRSARHLGPYKRNRSNHG